MSRTTLAAALLVSLALASSAQAQFSLSLGNGGGKSFNLSVGGGRQSGFVPQGHIQQVGGWTPVRQGRPRRSSGHLHGGHFHSGPVMIGPSVQPVRFQQHGWQPMTPVSRVLHGNQGQISVLGMPTRGGQAIGGSQTFTHVRRDHTGTHTTTRTVHANGTTSIQRSAVGVPVQALTLMP